jgi:protein arginine kinase
MSIWYEQKGPLEDVVISSRVRLARNLVKYPFPHRSNNDDYIKLSTEVKNAINNISGEILLKYTDLEGYSENDLDFLVEKHIISPEMAQKTGARGIVTNQDESLCVMVNEEDHLRIQSLLPGLQFEVAYKMCYDFENRLNKYIPFAYDETFGYLTSCPTNVGTGLRASAMMFLPMLVTTGMMNKILEACSKFGVAVRGVYGEHSEASGFIFQISNQVTLGQREEEIIENISHIISQITEQERALRKEIYLRSKVPFEDRVFRAYGILANARSISCNEAMELFASVRLGIDAELLSYIDIRDMNKLMVLVQPSNIKKIIGDEASAELRDQKRAELIRNVMNKGVC